MSDTTPLSAYRIETKQLVIRCWQPTDAELLKEAVDASIDHLRPWMPWAYHEPTDLDAKIKLLRRFRSQFDRDEEYVYGVFEQDESRVLGGSGLHGRIGASALEIGYWIRAGAINRGLATETAAALTKAAFEVNGVNRVEIHCDPRNVASAAIPRKLGFVHEATLQKRVPSGVGNDLTDSMIWTMFKDGYPDSPTARAEIAAFDCFGRKIL